MGRNYESELELVSATAEWIASLDLSNSRDAFSRLRCLDLVIVASGGSIAAAHLLAQLHTSRTGRLAVVMTPLEFITDTGPLDAAACFISAGGANNDILQAWHAAESRSVRDVALLCGDSRSPLAQVAHETGLQTTIVFDIPAGRDGFLATNSLIAFCSVILRLYDVTPPHLPQRPRLMTAGEFLDRSTTVVLYAGWLKPVAVDLESRFTEAALGSIQATDYRNFAHGRHHWLAKRGANSSVLALVSPTFAALARDTLAQLPEDIPIERWEFTEDSPEVALVGLQRAMEFAGIVATKLGYDAGRPGVPEFGHRIYELRTPPQPPVSMAREAAFARKLRAYGSAKDHRNQVAQALTNFEKRLSDAAIAGVVLDYDGTIVATARRFEAIEASMATELNRLLEAGLLLGVATGRGKSVRDKLRAAIAPAHWSKCTVGYYNGGIVQSLVDSCDGFTDITADPMIAEAATALRAAPELEGAQLDTRPLQITVTRGESDEHSLWMKVRGALERSNIGTLRVVHSSHSVDVVPANVSKVTVVNYLARGASVDESAILKIGDRGRWPGNDAELLAMQHGLSVDQISGDPDSCWNLAPLGLAGPLATVYYLQHVNAGRYKL